MDTLLDVTIFFYIKWIKKRTVNFPAVSIVSISFSPSIIPSDWLHNILLFGGIILSPFPRSLLFLKQWFTIKCISICRKQFLNFFTWQIPNRYSHYSTEIELVWKGITYWVQKTFFWDRLWHGADLWKLEATFLFIFLVQFIWSFVSFVWNISW